MKLWVYSGGIKKTKGELDCGLYTYRVKPIYMQNKDAILLTRYGTSEDSDKALAMLYTLADKFLTGKELEEIKEAVVMTKLGQMLFDDGYKHGELKGKIIGALLSGKTPEEVAEMLKISLQEVLKVQEEESSKSIKEA